MPLRPGHPGALLFPPTADERMVDALATGFVPIPLPGWRGDWEQTVLVRSGEGVVDVVRFQPGQTSWASRFQVQPGPAQLYRAWPVLRSDARVDPGAAIASALNWPEPDEDTLNAAAPHTGQQTEPQLGARTWARMWPR